MSLGIRLRVRGLDEVSRRVKSLGNGAEKMLLEELGSIGQEILDQAQREVPLDTGALMSSGRVHTGTRGGRASLAVSFGRQDVVNPKTGTPTAEYAVVQHEDLSLSHAPGRKAKYLEGPAVAMAPQIPLRLGGAFWRKVRARTGV